MKTNHIASALLTTTFVLALSVTQFGCKSTAGDVGPAGTTGATGAAGPAGPQGAVGTANVTQISFGSRTHAGGNITFAIPASVTPDMISKSSFFVYTQNSIGSWYPLPGIFNGTNEYRTYMLPATATVTLNVLRATSAANFGGTDIFAATRLLIIPAATLINGRRAAPDLDYANYEAVKRYYQLAD